MKKQFNWMLPNVDRVNQCLDIFRNWKCNLKCINVVTVVVVVVVAVAVVVNVVVVDVVGLVVVAVVVTLIKIMHLLHLVQGWAEQMFVALKELNFQIRFSRLLQNRMQIIWEAWPITNAHASKYCNGFFRLEIKLFVYEHFFLSNVRDVRTS